MPEYNCSSLKQLTPATTYATIVYHAKPDNGVGILKRPGGVQSYSVRKCRDVNTRAKKLGAQNPSRTLAQIETMFQAALIGYDEGNTSGDRVLAGAIFIPFFKIKCDDFCKLETLVKYVTQQVYMLDNLSRNEFLVMPAIPWFNLGKDTFKKKLIEPKNEMGERNILFNAIYHFFVANVKASSPSAYNRC